MVPDGELFPAVGSDAALFRDPPFREDDLNAEQFRIISYALGVSVALITRGMADHQSGTRIVQPPDHFDRMFDSLAGHDARGP